MRLAFCFILCVFHHAVFAQSQPTAYTEVKGVLIDSLTSQPIQYAHIRTRHFTVTSDLNGVFNILALPLDSIHISHIGYHSVVIPFHSSKPVVYPRITLIQKVNQLNSVVIHGLSEESFRKKVLETTPAISSEEQNAKNNIAVLNYYIKSLPQLPMNGYENYREQIKGPQGVIIFSTSGQGLIKAIRNVIKTKPIPYKSFNHENKSTPSVERNTIIDSATNAIILVADSLRVKN